MAGPFSVNISKFVEKANKRTEEVIKDVAMEMFSRVIQRTPVDTGRLRANWGCSIETPYRDTVVAVDPSGTATINKMRRSVYDWNAVGSIILSNNLPYALAAEYGHSKQAPQGMIRVTMAEFGAVVQEAARNAK